MDITLVQIIAIYISPQCKYSGFTYKLDKFKRETDITPIIIIIGDFNMKSIIQLSKGFNGKVEKHIEEKYILRQIVTGCMTSSKSQVVWQVRNQLWICALQM